MNRTILTTLLFALMLFQAMGWLLAWCAAQAQARQQAAHQMQHTDTPILHLVCSKMDFQQNKVGRKEILWKGHLYDIKSIAKQGDSLLLALHHDEREERLFSMLGQLLHAKNTQNPTSNPPLLQWLIHWLSVVFIVPNSTQIEEKILLAPSSPGFSYLFFLPSAPARPVFSPPWQFFPT